MQRKAGLARTSNRPKASELLLLRAVFQAGDTTFVMLSDLKEGCCSVAQCSDLTGVFLALAQKKFGRLR